MSKRRVVWLVISAVVACAGSSEQKRSTSGRLPVGIVAAVGDEFIGSNLVASIARAQGLPPAKARDAAVGDALFSIEARHRGAPTAHLQRIARARGVLEAVRDDAKRQGPPSDAEIATITASRWWELDRPEMRRTTHVVVRVLEPSQDAPARAAIVRIAQAVAHARDSATFYERASRMTVQGLEVRTEHLDPVTSDGRVLDPDNPPPPGREEQRFDRDFVDAVFAIKNVGDQSPIVRTKFGYHIILYAAQLPEHRVPLDERKRLLESEVVTRRADAATRALLARLRHDIPVSVERSAVELTGQLQGGS